MIVLGIETSCDETAVAVVKDDKTVLSHLLYTQSAQHKAYKGVVPEVAARAHLEILPDLLTQAVTDAGVTYEEIDGIAATCGPGLIGGVMVGALTGKTLAALYDKPFLAVNHLAAHGLTVRLTHEVAFPYLLLLVSGGHTQLLLVKDVQDFELLGTTLDDAVGEAFDKTARILGFGYPGGPALERLAREGDARAFSLPRPLLGKDKSLFGCTFSLSGLKTAVRRHYDLLDTPTDADRASLAASFQSAVADILSSRLENALVRLTQENVHFTNIVVAGGVAANLTLRQRLEEVAQKFQMILIAPPVNLCTDNAVMVAWTGMEKLQRGLVDSLAFSPRPRWPLTNLMGEQ
ncbi:MAG: tRNA (adenosine(37)-N6)-threonylcarbamoyltransferase complex transferase subunit TsaD [Alphaproteobacteria bacterium]|nr:tRNA (adenosine(37)-N6)-threonylcarbamoyltransferase complex transferase subunit TsaD [Alphaproteobacteria bacterium]